MGVNDLRDLDLSGWGVPWGALPRFWHRGRASLRRRSQRRGVCAQRGRRGGNPCSHCPVGFPLATLIAPASNAGNKSRSEQPWEGGFDEIHGHLEHSAGQMAAALQAVGVNVVGGTGECRRPSEDRRPLGRYVSTRRCRDLWANGARSRTLWRSFGAGCISRGGLDPESPVGGSFAWKKIRRTSWKKINRTPWEKRLAAFRFHAGGGRG